MTDQTDLPELHIVGPDPEVSARIDALLNARRAARAERDFETADRIRAVLDGAGVVVIDSPEVSAWKCGPDFDPDKLVDVP